ncbi:SDR family oxidoreductase [Nocardioides sp. AE5]|uniref:SDR family NAD(P)-dependent oxidoreductase n=1 Tax=Nocardioides sp. AE5 TaxID=2962573 RepID=UPI0028825E00|nr:SDR family oxidoreductase [Nocardioides sp. AE5]MDT0203161.1 SDR family oxidoreductase [Nocardioides sp. AE5]
MPLHDGHGTALQDRSFVVTGGASGIGWATCRVLAESGATVISVDTQPAASPLPRGVHTLVGDVTADETWEQVGKLIRAIAPAGVSGLVACAGANRAARIIETTAEEFRSLFEVNVIGVLKAMQAVLPAMVARKDGSVVVVSSVDALFAEDAMAAYSASKAAVVQLARTAAVEHARDNIRINVVCPGATDTPMLRHSFESMPDPAEVQRRLEDQTPSGRLVAAHEVANVLAFLAGPLASGMSGSVLVVDGGLTSTYDFSLTPRG